MVLGMLGKIGKYGRRAFDFAEIYLNYISEDWLLLIKMIALIRARREEDISVSYSGVAGCLIAGIIMAIAKPLVAWLTGVDPDNPGGGLPAEVSSMFSKLLSLIMYLGVVLVVIGLIWAGMNMLRRWKTEDPAAG